MWHNDSGCTDACTVVFKAQVMATTLHLLLLSQHPQTRLHTELCQWQGLQRSYFFLVMSCKPFQCLDGVCVLHLVPMCSAAVRWQVKEPRQTR